MIEYTNLAFYQDVNENGLVLDLGSHMYMFRLQHKTQCGQLQQPGAILDLRY